MTDSNPSFLGRISLAVGTFFSILGDGSPPGSCSLRDGGVRLPGPAPSHRTTPAPVLKEASPTPLQLLGLLQRDAPSSISSRRHQDLQRCRHRRGGAPRARRLPRELREAFTIRRCATKPRRRVTLAEGFDAASIRLTGNVVGKAPFNGSISHRGWRVEEVRLPKLAESHNAKVIAPAEVEL